jgi:hypothetical protein
MSYGRLQIVIAAPEIGNGIALGWDLILNCAFGSHGPPSNGGEFLFAAAPGRRPDPPNSNRELRSLPPVHNACPATAGLTVPALSGTAGRGLTK